MFFYYLEITWTLNAAIIDSADAIETRIEVLASNLVSG